MALTVVSVGDRHLGRVRRDTGSNHIDVVKKNLIIIRKALKILNIKMPNCSITYIYKNKPHKIFDVMIWYQGLETLGFKAWKACMPLNCFSQGLKGNVNRKLNKMITRTQAWNWFSRAYGKRMNSIGSKSLKIFGSRRVVTILLSSTDPHKSLSTQLKQYYLCLEGLYAVWRMGKSFSTTWKSYSKATRNILFQRDHWLYGT